MVYWKDLQMIKWFGFLPPPSLPFPSSPRNLLCLILCSATDILIVFQVMVMISGVH